MKMPVIAFFKAVSVLRLLCVPVIFILDKLWHDSIHHTGAFDGLLDGIKIEMPWWTVPLAILIFASFSINTLSALAISFKPTILAGPFFRNKIFLMIFYITELLLVPFYFDRLYKKVRNDFFPENRDYGIIGKILSPLFPPNEKAHFIEQLQAINFCLLFLCIFLFLLLFWKCYAKRLRLAAV